MSASATATKTSTDDGRPATMFEMDQRDNYAWVYSAAAAMVPFTAVVYGHSRGVTSRIVERVVKSPVGVYGLFALPILSLAMEKSIYDTVQAWQGLEVPQEVLRALAGHGSSKGGGAPTKQANLIIEQSQDVPWFDVAVYQALRMKECYATQQIVQ